MFLAAKAVMMGSRGQANTTATTIIASNNSQSDLLSSFFMVLDL
jgi:hypothetical protein